MTHQERSLEALRAQLGQGVLASETFRGQTTVVLDRAALVSACRLLREDPDLDYNLLAALTASDHWPQEPRFSLVYQLYSLRHRTFLGLRVDLPGDEPQAPTLEMIYPNASWHEREVFDMFGIQFEGHSDLRRILMPHDWEGHPLRKDYPLGYEEVQFSFNHEEIDRRKPYARE